MKCLRYFFLFILNKIYHFHRFRLVHLHHLLLHYQLNHELNNCTNSIFLSRLLQERLSYVGLVVFWVEEEKTSLAMFFSLCLVLCLSVDLTINCNGSISSLFVLDLTSNGFWISSSLKSKPKMAKHCGCQYYLLITLAIQNFSAISKLCPQIL